MAVNTESEKKQTPSDDSSKAKKSATKSPAKKDVKGSSKSKEQGEKKATLIANTSNYPRHSLEKALRIPKAILEQNAGKEVTDKEAAKFLGITNTRGSFSVELSSSLKYGFLEKPGTGLVKPTELAKRILRPQSSEDELKGLREAVLKAPVISDVYKHYRGENLPDRQFFENALIDTFKIPREKISEFIEIFTESLNKA